MAAAANFAWVNRSSMTFLTRQAFAKQFRMSADDLDMHVIYDVSHNIAKIEQHVIDGRLKTLLVHRKVSYCSLFSFQFLLFGVFLVGWVSITFVFKKYNGFITLL